MMYDFTFLFSIYMILLSSFSYGVKIDIWASGVIVYILLCGFSPFNWFVLKFIYPHITGELVVFSKVWEAQPTFV